MTAEKIPLWIERLLLPKLSEIGGDIKALDVKMGSLINETKTGIEGFRKEILSKFEGTDYRFEAINTKLDSLEKRIQS